MRTRWTTLGAVLALSAGQLMAGKGGGGGKPGGGGDPPPAANPAIAYAQLGTSGWAVKVMNADGSNQNVLVADAGDEFADPAWSPDGSKLIFSATDRLDGTGIYVVPVDGSAAPQKLYTTLKGGSHNVMWSPVATPDDREKIVFHDNDPGANGDVWVVNTDGSDPIDLTQGIAGSHLYPAWSRNADQIAVARQRRVTDPSTQTTYSRYDLILYDLGVDASGAVAITGESNLTDVPGSPLQDLADGRYVAWQRYHAAWARHTDRIVVSVYEVVDGKDNIDLWEIDPLDPAHPVRLTDTSERAGASFTIQEQHGDYSPDDGFLVFRMRARGGASGIYFMNADGTGSTAQLLSADDVRSPAWRR